MYIRGVKRSVIDNDKQSIIQSINAKHLKTILYYANPGLYSLRYICLLLVVHTRNNGDLFAVFQNE